MLTTKEKQLVKEYAKKLATKKKKLVEATGDRNRTLYLDADSNNTPSLNFQIPRILSGKQIYFDGSTSSNLRNMASPELRQIKDIVSDYSGRMTDLVAEIEAELLKLGNECEVRISKQIDKFNM